MPLLTRNKPAKGADQIDTTSDWYERPVEATVADLKGVNSATRKETYRRWAIIACLALGALGFLFAVGTASKISGLNSSISAQDKQIQALKNRPTGGVSTVSTSPGRFAAQQALTSWLSNDPSPLPGGKLLYWTGSSTIPNKSKTDVRDLESFALVDGQGNGYTATMEVAIDPRGGAQVLAGPSMESIPGNASDNWASTAPWTGVTVSGDVPTQVNGAAQSWANAYFSGNSQQLGLAVGDPNGKHAYEPMTKATSVSVDTKSYAALGNGMAIAQVEMTVTWPTASSDQTSTGNPIVMDVLLKNPNTGAPAVVAWGAPGTGPTLRPYQNALTVPETALAAPTQSATPTQVGPSQNPAKTQTPTQSPQKSKGK